MCLSSWLASAIIMNVAIAAGTPERDRTNGTVGAAWDSGTFQSPSVYARPKFRYWAPDAYIDDDRVDYDLHQFKAIGMGGFELIPFMLYGDPNPEFGYPPVDWADWGFGSENWNNKFIVFLERADRYGLTVDFSLGPNQGAGVPVNDTDIAGLSTGLELGNVTVQAGQTFRGTAPEPNRAFAQNGVYAFPTTDDAPATLVGLSAARVTRSTNDSIYLDEQSAIQLPTSESGQLDFTAPGTDNSTWFIFAYWQRRTGQLEARGGYTGRQLGKPASGGSFFVDHFSAAGAKLSTDFFDSQVINSTIDGYLRRVGLYAWEDSIEANFPLQWTDSLASDFQAMRGYSPFTSAPLLFSGYQQRFYFDSPDRGERFRTDFYQTLTEKYIEYQQAYGKWAHSRGIRFSNQAAYNEPLDVAAAAAVADAPEGESLGFRNNVDTFRQYAGASHINEARILSSECGASPGQGYLYTWPQLMYDVKANWAGGVNQFVLHGSPYSGDYPNTTWPGYTPFTYTFSGLHDSRQPAWQMYRPNIDYIARGSQILQTGMFRSDLAIYRYAFDLETVSIWQDGDLNAAGYTWDYLSPYNFDLPKAFVRQGRLAPDGPAYKALIINNETSIPAQAAQHLIEYAQNGLPIIFVGETPQRTPGNDTVADGRVRDLMVRLLASPNVRTVRLESEVEPTLHSLNIVPGAASSFVSIRRYDSETENHYFYLFNNITRSPDPSASGLTTRDVTLEASGTPFVLDAWTGCVTRLTTYNSTNTTISLTLTLPVNGSTFIAVGSENAFDEPGAGLPHVTTPHQANLTFAGNGFLAKSFTNGPETVRLSNGSDITLAVPQFNETRRQLNDWHLDLEDWRPTSNASSVDTNITRLSLDITSPASWTNLRQDLQNVSGIGYYSTTFTWDEDPTTTGLILTLGRVVHTMSVRLNGKQLRAVELVDAWIDLGSDLTQGENKLEVKVASTLQNRLLDVPFELQTSGFIADPPYAERQDTRQDYGLLGPVELIPYGKVLVPL